MSSDIELGMILRDYCYSNFGWLGKSLSSIFKGMEKDLESACMKIHPEVYLSQVGLLAIISGIVPLIVFGLISFGLFSLPIDLGIAPIMLVPAALIIPIIIIGVGVLIPNSAASNRLDSLKIEIPYASM